MMNEAPAVSSQTPVWHRWI